MLNVNVELPLVPEHLRKLSHRSTKHEMMRYQLIKRGLENGLIPLLEYKVPGGRIDAAWLDTDGRLIAVFEIDFSYKPKSLKKLVESNAQYKYWVVMRKGSRIPHLPAEINLIKL